MDFQRISALQKQGYKKNHRCCAFRRILSNGFWLPNIDNITKLSYNIYKKLRQGTKIPTIFCMIRRSPRLRKQEVLPMISTGIVRHIDALGRVVLPKELRRTFGISAETPLEILTEGDAILLRKYRPADACALCGEVVPGSVQLHGKFVCPACRQALTQK